MGFYHTYGHGGVRKSFFVIYYNFHRNKNMINDKGVKHGTDGRVGLS